MKTIISSSIAQTYALAKDIMDHIHDDNRVICLYGELGGGKTTLAQGILQYCGAEGPYTSPTFTIMKQYDVTSGKFERMYHIDAYRIKSEDMIELGWQEIIDDPKNVVIIEWPEHIQDLLPEKFVRITCEWIDDTTHKYVINI